MAEVLPPASGAIKAHFSPLPYHKVCERDFFMSEDQAQYITDALEMIGIAEPRKIVTEVSGFIPVFEVVLHHYKDYMTALVFGRMWQYCNMSDGVCKAGLERIGRDLEISAVTVMRHAEKLVADGYLIDTTPDRRNAPHEYLDGRKVEMKSRITAGMTESNPTVIKSNASVIKSQLIKQDNTKDNKKPNGDLVDFELSKLPAISIRKAVLEYFKLNINWDKKQNRQWMEWAVENNVTAEQIQRAADTWKTDKQFNWQVPTLNSIFEKWNLLMDSGQPATPSQTDGKGFYA